MVGPNALSSYFEARLPSLSSGSRLRASEGQDRGGDKDAAAGSIGPLGVAGPQSQRWRWPGAPPSPDETLPMEALQRLIESDVVPIERLCTTQGVSSRDPERSARLRSAGDGRSRKLWCRAIGLQSPLDRADA